MIELNKINEMEADLAKHLGLAEEHVKMIGSTFILGTPGNDYDYLCYTAHAHAIDLTGYKPDIVEDYDDVFKSWRKDNVNLILTQNEAFFISEATIATAARQAYIMGLDQMCSRDGRIAFHREVRHLMGFYCRYKDVK